MHTIPTIPVGGIIYASLLSPFVHFRRFLWDAGLLIVSTYLLVIIPAAIGVAFGALNGRPGEGLLTLVLVVALAAYGSIAVDFLVRWHKAVMSDGQEPRASFFPRFARTHLRYFLYLLGICLLAAGFVLIMGFVTYAILSGLHLGSVDRTATGYVTVTVLLRTGLTVILIALLGRFLLMLPIVATGGNEPYYSAESLYAGQWLPVSLALGGVSLILMLVQFAFAMSVWAAAGSETGVLVFVGVQALLFPLVIVLGLGIFASALTLTCKELAAVKQVEPVAAE